MWLWVWPSKVSLMIIVLTKVDFEEYLRNIFNFTLSFFQALFKRWINNKLKFTRVIFISYFLLYSIVHYYTHFKKTISDHGSSNPKKKPWTTNTKIERWLMSSGRPRVVGTCTFLCPVKLMLCRSNFFLHLLETILYLKQH